MNPSIVSSECVWTSGVTVFMSEQRCISRYGANFTQQLRHISMALHYLRAGLITERDGESGIRSTIETRRDWRALVCAMSIVSRNSRTVLLRSSTPPATSCTSSFSSTRPQFTHSVSETAGVRQ